MLLGFPGQSEYLTVWVGSDTPFGGVSEFIRVHEVSVCCARFVRIPDFVQT